MATARRSLLVLTVTLALFLAGCTDSGTRSQGDDDGDGLPEAFELKPREVCVQTMEGENCRSVTSDHDAPDTDGDGLNDDEEIPLGTFPDDIDSDGDGLLDGGNIDAVEGSAEYDRFMSEGIILIGNTFQGERGQCSDGADAKPTKAESEPATFGSDGLSDGEEVLGWTITAGGGSRTVKSDPCSPDTDGDGLKDGDEKAKGADPLVRDTDSDGVSDGMDMDPAANLGVKLVVERMQLSGARGATGAQLTFILQVPGDEDRRTRTVQGGQAQTLNLELAGDADDTGAVGGSTQRTPVILTIVDGGGSALNVGGGQNLQINYDMIKEDWNTGSQSGSGKINLSGPDGSVTLVVTTTRA